MKKDFQMWHKKKEFLHEKKQRPFFHEGEVWFCAFGVNIGFEQDGGGKGFLRPALIVKKFNNEVCWGVPLTKHQKKGQYYFSFTLNKEVSTAILSQVRLIDGKRLHYKLGTIDASSFVTIQKRLARFLA